MNKYYIIFGILVTYKAYFFYKIRKNYKKLCSEYPLYTFTVIYPDNGNDDTRSILLIGDSLVTSVGSNLLYGPKLLSNEKNLIIYTISKIGLKLTKIDEFYDKIEYILKNYNIEYILLCLSTNDYLRVIEKDKIMINLDYINNFKLPVKIIIGDITNFKIFPVVFRKYLSINYNKILDILNEYNMKIINLNFPDNQDLIVSSDKIHLNENGYNYVIPIISKYLD